MSNQYISKEAMEYLEEKKTEIRSEIESAMNNEDAYREAYYKGQKRLIQDIVRYFEVK